MLIDVGRLSNSAFREMLECGDLDRWVHPAIRDRMLRVLGVERYGTTETVVLQHSLLPSVNFTANAVQEG